MAGRRRVATMVAGAFIGLGAGAPSATAADFDGGAAFFTTPIAAGAPIDARSGAWVGGLLSANRHPYLNGPTGVFAPPVYAVDASTPLVEVRCRFCGAYTGEGETKYEDTVRVPIPAGATPDPSADGHIAFVDRARGREWNLFQARDDGNGTWSAGGAGQFDLRGDGSQNVVLGGGSATGSHLPLSQAASPEEVLAAIQDGTFTIPHALQWGAPNVDGRCWVYPALGSDGGTRGGLPQGARIQLDPAFDVSGLTPGARVIARTLQTYGAYLRDLSGAFVVYLRPQRGADQPWSALGIDGDSLAAIPTEMFRVLQADHATAGTPNQPKVQRPATDCGPGADRVAPIRSPDDDADADGSPVTGQAVTGPRPLAPRNLRVRTRLVDGRRRVQFVWNSRQSRFQVPRYRIYVDGRTRATVPRTFTGYLVLPRGRHVVQVAGISRRGVVGARTRAVRFTL